MQENAPLIHVLDHKVRLYQPLDGFRTSMDSVFVAAACPAKAGDRVLDLGCGVGGAAFCLLHRVSVQLTGIDIQKSHIDLAVQNIALNNVDGRATFITADIKNFNGAGAFDHVLCNPPFLEAGAHTPPSSIARAQALGHLSPQTGLKDWLKAAHGALKNGGCLTLIHRADAVDNILQSMGARFGGIEIIPLWPRHGISAKRVIIRALKGRKSPASIHPGLVLHEEDGRYTAAADQVLRAGGAIA